MDDNSKLAFNYAAEFLKVVLSISAGTLSFLLTFNKEFISEKISFLILICWLLAVIFLLISSLFALSAMREFIYEITQEQVPCVIAKAIREKIKISVYSLYLAYFLLIIFIVLRFLAA